MTAKGYRLSVLAIAVVLGGLFIWAVIAEFPIWIPILAIVLAMIIKMILKRRTTETLTDERLKSISYRAISISFRIFSIGMAIFGLAFIIFKNSLPYEFGIIGATLAFSVCIMMVMYLSFYYCFVRRS
jgi:uncharacterized membrane protein